MFDVNEVNRKEIVRALNITAEEKKFINEHVNVDVVRGFIEALNVFSVSEGARDYISMTNYLSLVRNLIKETREGQTCSNQNLEI
jgi:hypothetical protein